MSEGGREGRRKEGRKDGRSKSVSMIDFEQNEIKFIPFLQKMSTSR